MEEKSFWKTNVIIYSSNLLNTLKQTILKEKNEEIQDIILNSKINM